MTRRTVAAAAVVLAALVPTSGCSESLSAFCAASRGVEKLSDKVSSTKAGLSAEQTEDLVAAYDKLADSAPEELKAVTDKVTEVVDERAADGTIGVGDLRELTSGATDNSTVKRELTEIEDFTRKNCED